MSENYQPEFNLGKEGEPSFVPNKYFEKKSGETEEEYRTRMFNLAKKAAADPNSVLIQKPSLKEINNELAQENPQNIPPDVLEKFD